MNTVLIEKLRQGRIDKGYKQSDVTKLTGIKNTTLSNYENGITEPDMDTFLKLCEVYGLDYAAVLGEAYGSKVQSNDFWITSSEIDLLKKLRALSPHAQETIRILIDREHDGLVDKPTT